MDIKDAAREKLEKLIKTLPYAGAHLQVRVIMPGSYNKFVCDVVGACGVNVLKESSMLEAIIFKALKDVPRSRIDYCYNEITEAVSLKPKELESGILKPAFDMLPNSPQGRSLQDNNNQKRFVECVLDSIFRDSVDWIDNLKDGVFHALDGSKNIQSMQDRAEMIANVLKILSKHKT